jgi:iron-chelate-transporting ATPase
MIGSGPALIGADLTLAYDGREVVHDARIQLRAGEVVALVGPNGSGKSTLLRSLARLHTPRSGAVTLAGGADALALGPKDFARRVTLLTQSRPTPGGVRVRDVVAYGRHPYRGRAATGAWSSGRRGEPGPLRGWFGAGDAGGAEVVERSMRRTGVAGMAERPVDELSGGELQRVWLATCLAQDTGVVLLDEPTTFLDLRYQVEILDLVRDLADEHGVAVGVVLHDLDQAAAVADTVVLLHHGRVRATGRPAEVFTAGLLTDVYGLPIEVHADDAGRVRTQPVGRHTHRPRATTPA